jgi:uncharacterized protein
MVFSLLVGAFVAADVSPVAGQDPASETPRLVRVSAHASVQRPPDRAVVQLAVETMAATAGGATRENAATMDRVLAALRQLGIPENRIRTTRIELQPRYDHRQRPEETPPPIVGYQAINQVMVRLDDMELVGRVVDAAVGAGANRVTGISFELSDPQTAYHEALRLAVARARAEAEVLADALGEPLGAVMEVSTGGLQLPPLGMGMVAARMEAMDVAATTIQPGELDVQAHVSIAYRLGQ